MTLPQDPGEASLKGTVSVKNVQGEPVACVALDSEARQGLHRSSGEMAQKIMGEAIFQPWDGMVSRSIERGR